MIQGGLIPRVTRTADGFSRPNFDRNAGLKQEPDLLPQIDSGIARKKFMMPASKWFVQVPVE